MVAELQDRLAKFMVVSKDVMGLEQVPPPGRLLPVLLILAPDFLILAPDLLIHAPDLLIFASDLLILAPDLALVRLARVSRKRPSFLSVTCS